MRRIALFGIAGGFLLSLLAAAPASAQATRTWVSGVGDDVNPCSRTAPCKTFAGAISKTAINGEINCLDPGGYGAVTITKSITIDCTGTFGSILNSGTNGVIVNATNAGGTDPLRIVRLRGLSINGSGNGTRSGIRGVSILSALQVHIEDVRIDNQTQQGIADVRTNAGTLFVSKTTIRNNGIAGMGLASSGGTLNVTLDNVLLEGNAIGIASGAANINVLIKQSMVSGNATNGVQADGGQITVEGSAISSNNVGVQANSGTVRLSNNDIMFNIGNAINGTTTSFGFNRIAGNGGAGTAPTAAGGPTNALGTQ
jgi:hypothetical protein